MATLIPSLGTCVSRMTSGERRLAERLEAKLFTLREEAAAITDQINQARKEGFAWGDMAVLCADTKTRDLCARTLAQRKLPVESRISPGHFDPTSNKIKVMTMKVSKGLEFPVVALPGVGHMPMPGEDEKEVARVFYVAATRATQRLLMTTNTGQVFGVNHKLS
ncbi:MAG: ATP-dependent helicase [Curvibacter sp.]|nr:MAG: ATP-dependent helicase [Curvibacter sp.]